jgi:DNA-binding transcriptional LysR family regulator
MKFTIKQLEIFVTIANHEHMSQAAEQLHLTQSACSMSLSTLENQLNGPLFIRHGKKLLLNERGKVLLPKALNILGQLQEIEATMTEGKQKVLTAEITIGASSTIGNYVLPAIIGTFITEHPQVKIKLQVGNTEQIIQNLLKFTIDVGMIEGTCHAPDIDVVPWCEDELILIAAPSHPLSKKKNILRTDLYQAKWVLREQGSGTREKFEEVMQGQAQPFLELGNTEAIKQAVQSGLGISCVSKLTVIDNLKAKKIVELKVPFLNLTRQFYILFHKQKFKTTALKKLIKEFTPIVL